MAAVEPPFFCISGGGIGSALASLAYAGAIECSEDRLLPKSFGNRRHEPPSENSLVDFNLGLTRPR